MSGEHKDPYNVIEVLIPALHTLKSNAFELLELV